jgi:GH15 family glucan-1,4-alpha-glucosidase
VTLQYKDLEAYGIIGNIETCALVGDDGSIDWLCFPYLESPSVFAALLDAQRGGCFRVRPAAQYSATQAYIDRTNVLQTTFNTSSGSAILTDFMPVRGMAEGPNRRAVYRKVECTRGAIEIAVEFAPRPDYGRAAVALEAAGYTVSVRWGEERLALSSPVTLTVDGDRASGVAHLTRGASLWLILQYGDGAVPADADCDALLDAVRTYWRNWTSVCSLCDTFDNPRWSEILIRSGLVLELLTVPENGAIAAAATTSLPESIGGARNWDYRFAWVRDASFTTQALFHLGHAAEARAFRSWVRERVVQAGSPANLRVLYSLRGDDGTAEQVLQNLSGYRNSAPVRIGNGAVGQRQLDIYGEALQAVYDTTRYGENVTPENWSIYSELVDYVCRIWDTEDSGIWEIRGRPRHYVYSKLMCWVALDRGVRIAQLHGSDSRLTRWQSARDEIRQAILTKGFDNQLNTFVQSFGSKDLDAANLLIPQMEFLPATDARVQGTIDATLAHLTTPEGLVYRYRSDDGLPGQEGAFVLCSFWLVTTLALAGRIEEAEKVFDGVARYLSPLGLMAEEVDPVTGKQLGNIPQAFSHRGLINSLLYLNVAKGKPHAGPKPTGAQAHDGSTP